MDSSMDHQQLEVRMQEPAVCAVRVEQRVKVKENVNEKDERKEEVVKLIDW